MSSIAEYEAMLRRARWFLEEAEEALEKGRFDLACFFAEQSVQLRIKAALLKLTGTYPRLHQIRLLLGELAEALPACRGKISEFIRANRSLLSELEDAYLLSRYGSKQYSMEDAQDMVRIARQAWSLVEEVEESCA